ncbi:MAG: hypothetical protein GY833_23930 [Aestuariibacter sp.]|nr:hypothetical protein [Aestuariibacter sp.]
MVEFDIDFDDTGRFDPELPASASIAAEVKVNGVLRGSTDGTPITVTLDDRACGHTVEIISDATSTNYVGTVSGYVKLISIT